jgi:hypothetical protein
MKLCSLEVALIESPVECQSHRGTGRTMPPPSIGPVSLVRGKAREDAFEFSPILLAPESPSPSPHRDRETGLGATSCPALWLHRRYI